MIKTIDWTGDGVRMIDQRKLPTVEEYPVFKTYEEVAGAIRTMVVRGAPAIGVAAAMGVPVLAIFGATDERVLTAIVFSVSVAYLYLFRRYTTMEPDEGIVLQGAERILHGQVLYRDFFSFLTPGSFYLHALLFKIFGNSFIVPRTALAVIGGVLSLIGYLLARRVCSRSSALCQNRFCQRCASMIEICTGREKPRKLGCSDNVSMSNSLSVVPFDSTSSKRPGRCANFSSSARRSRTWPSPTSPSPTVRRRHRRAVLSC